MLTDIDIHYFKSFRHLSLKGLRSINVVVGHSASGKTSLLEAIRIGMSGHPQALWNLLALRGIPIFINPSLPREQLIAIWSQYFYNFDTSNPITFALTDREGGTSQVAISIESDTASVAVQDLPGLPPMLTKTNMLTVDRRSASGEASILKLHINATNGLQFDQGPELIGPSELIPPNQIANGQLAANWFSELSIENREKTIIEVLRRNFPNIEDLSVQSPLGLSSLHATVRYMPRKIPISAVSAGITKFVSVLLAIEHFSGGSLMLDEIENGIYYEMFPTFWQAMLSIAVSRNTQLFVSTHSLECLKGLMPALSTNPELFNLLQVHQEDGQSNVHVVPGEDALAAIRADIEVRS